MLSASCCFLREEYILSQVSSESGGGDPGDLVLIIPSFKPVLAFSKIIKCIYTTMIPKNKNKNKKERKFIQVHRGITSIEICLSRTIILCLVNYQVKYAILDPSGQKLLDSTTAGA